MEAIGASTLAVTRRYFDPYGNPAGTAPSSWPDANSYLGKPQDPNTSLDLLGARQYDPVTGRFLSVDPVLETGSPQQMGGYAYAGDNPATSSDPTGLCDTLGCPPPHVKGHEPAHGGPAAPGGGYPTNGGGGGPPPASSGGNIYQPISCSHLGTGCGGYTPHVFTQVPGGSLGFVAGLGGSLAGTANLVQCVLNPLLCLQQQATGTDASSLYTGWVHSQGISTSSHSTYNGGLWAGAVFQMAAGGLLGPADAATVAPEAASGADNVVNGVRLAQQLTRQEASSVFHTEW